MTLIDPSLQGANQPRGLRSDAVFSALKSKILGFEYIPGDSLTEIRIAKELNISRTPIREALRRLEHEHLVQIIPHKGAIVTGISEEDIREVYVIRQGLEGISASRATSRLSDENLAHLERSVSLAMEKLEQGETDAASTAADELHRLILSVGGTRRIRRMVANLKELTERLHEVAMQLPGRLKVSIEEHRAVVDALKSRDAEEAERRIRQHIASAEHDVVAAYRNWRTEGMQL